MGSWLSRTARYRCKRELYRPSSTQKAACRVQGRACTSGTVSDVTKRGRETHLHDYTRPPASLGDEVGRLSTSLELFASPPPILSTESVVVMEWTLTHGLVAEPYSSVQVRTGALPAVIHSESRVSRAGAVCPGPAVTSRRGRETHAHGC